tara:strand:+ start:10853 stop:11311 length:459 start_codon:yes stop_codon:yes gene_type:complete
MESVPYSIFIVGKNRGRGVYRVLSKKRNNIYYFSSEEDCLKSLKPHTRIVIIEDSSKSMALLEELRKFPMIYRIFLSNQKSFSNMVNVVRRGACDYILKDSYLYFSILRSIKKVDGINFNIEPSSQVYFDTCSLKEYYPVRFRIANWISRVK